MINQQQCLLQTCSSLIDLDKWQELVDMLADLYGASTGAIVQLRANEFNVVVTSNSDGNFLPKDTTWPWEMKSFCRHIMETRKDIYVGCAVEDECWKDAPAVAEGPVRSYCGAPIRWPDGELFGTICVIDTKSTQYEHSLSNLLQQLARLIGSDLQTACRLHEAESLALTDELTRLLNRRGYTLLGEQKLKEAPSYKLNVGLLYLDIDNLKSVNDKHGHSFGDLSITSVAKALGEICKPTDIVSRIGGDEFVVLTLTSDYSELENLGEAIRRQYKQLVSTVKELDVTDISVGIHYTNSDPELCLQTLIEHADEAMYLVKKQRKACIEKAHN